MKTKPIPTYRHVYTRPVVRGVEHASSQPTATGAAWSERLAFAVMIALILGAIAVVLVTRSSQAATRNVPDVLAHVGAAVAAPLRSVDALVRPRRPSKRALLVVSRIGRGFPAAVLPALRWLIARRGLFAFYGVASVLSAALGVAVVVLLSR